MVVMSDDANTSLAKRDTAGFFSNATGFFLPVGQQFDAGSVRGYYIDMRVKAEKPIWEGGEDRLYVVGTQWALGCYERYLAGEGEAWLAAATDWAEGGWDLDQSVEFSARLKDLGIDLIDCSSGGLAPQAKIVATYLTPYLESRDRAAAGKA